MCFIDSLNGVRSCLHCGKESKNRKFCSVSCAAKHRADQIRIVRVCQVCGKHFVKHGGGKGICCSRRCGFEWQRKQRAEISEEAARKREEERATANTRTCDECGRAFTANITSSRLCSPQCKRTRLRRREREKYSAWRQTIPLVSIKCKWCGAGFHRRGDETRRVFCSIRCGNRWVETQRRQRLRGAFVEAVSIGNLIERDKGICGLCGEHVIVNARVPHPLAPTIDHIYPISKGGKHMMGNVQLAHFRCNALKSDAIVTTPPPGTSNSKSDNLS